MKFAVFTVSLPEWTPAEAVRNLADLGYDGVEWRIADDPPHAAPSFWRGNRCTLPLTTLIEDAPRIRNMTATAGLTIPAVASYVQVSDLPNVEQLFRGAAGLETPMVRIQVPTYDGQSPFLKCWNQAKRDLGEVARLAHAYGIKALAEIHFGTIVPSASAMRQFLDGFDPTWVGAIYDPGNMVWEGYEQYRFGLEQLGPYLGHVHVKNSKWLQQGQREDGSLAWHPDWAPLDAGIVDVPALFVALRQMGYDGWVSVEDFTTERPLLDRVRENLVYLKASAAHPQ